MKLSTALLVVLSVPALCVSEEPPDTLWTAYLPDLTRAILNDVIETPDGGLLAVGSRIVMVDTFYSWKEMLLVKINALGVFEWSHQPPGSEDLHDGCAVTNTADGNYLALGRNWYWGTGESHHVLLKYSPAGNLLWQREYDLDVTDRGHDIISTDDGGFIIAGSASPGTLQECEVRAVLFKVNSDGDSLWTQFYEGDCDLMARKIAKTNDGGYVFTGPYYMSYSAGTFVIKTDSEGNEEWRTIYGEDQNQQPFGIAQTADGGYVIGGDHPQITHGTANLVTLDADGNFLQSYLYPPVGDRISDLIFDFILTSSGECVFAGSSVLETPDAPVLLECVGTNGEFMWNVDIPTTDKAFLRTVCEASDGGFIAAGSAYPADQSYYECPYFARFGQASEAGRTAPPVMTSFALHQNYPNPFNARTAIRFDVPATAPIRIALFDLLGREVAVLADQSYAAGTHSLTFDATRLPSGIYVYSLLAGQRISLRKLVILR